MAMDLQPLHALCNEHCNWEVRSIILQLSETLQQTEQESINLVSKVKSHVIVPSERFQPAEDKGHILWFPSTLTIANGRSSINYHLNDANGSSSIKKLLNHALQQCSCSDPVKEKQNQEQYTVHIFLSMRQKSKSKGCTTGECC
ncbi:unnamed protein product [Cylindrotheca closterium]|uniref:Uncharacterized protein n=1 Tax=Cylindrotheca closterium TaxID=2856 RepID=A0AAD2FRF7_9STRA|nr:unnamed protein product [Cylindrotheca closterium]